VLSESSPQPPVSDAVYEEPLEDVSDAASEELHEDASDLASDELREDAGGLVSEAPSQPVNDSTSAANITTPVDTAPVETAVPAKTASAA
jgi:hypothetical protein